MHIESDYSSIRLVFDIDNLAPVKLLYLKGKYRM